MTEVPTSIDRTHPGVFCKVHGDGSPAAYLGRERYGCWHCNPTRPAPPALPEPSGLPIDHGWDGSTEIPDWMTGAES